MLSYYEKPHNRDIIFEDIAILIGLIIFIAGICIRIVFKNSYFIMNVIPKGFAKNCFFWIIYFIVSYILSIIITLGIKTIYIKITNKRKSHV